jgi:hypothetical protein
VRHVYAFREGLIARMDVEDQPERPGCSTILSSGGGVVGTVRAVFHMSPNGNIVDLNFGTCQLPEEE